MFCVDTFCSATFVALHCRGSQVARNVAIRNSSFYYFCGALHALMPVEIVGNLISAGFDSDYEFPGDRKLVFRVGTDADAPD
jgi:hypothetical protein